MSALPARISSTLRPLGPLGGLAAGGAVLAAVALLWCAGAIMVAAVAPASVKQPPEGTREKRIAAYQAGIDKRLAQINGRSMFFVPPPPAPPEPPPDEHKDEPPPPPSVYGGPDIIAMVYDGVWFNDGRILKVGDDADSGLRVISVSPPWLARLEWRGVEFDVTLFKRTTGQFLVKPEPEPEPEPASPPEAQPAETPPSK